MDYVMRRQSTVGGAFNVLVTVTVTVTNRKPICDFLLVFHSNYILIFYGFLDITIYWFKNLRFRRFYQLLVWSPRKECSPRI